MSGESRSLKCAPHAVLLLEFAWPRCGPARRATLAWPGHPPGQISTCCTGRRHWRGSPLHVHDPAVRERLWRS